MSENKAKKVVPRVMLAAVSRGVGLSSVLLGMLVCYRKSGLSIGVGSLGDSLVHTTHFRRVSGRLAHSVDPTLLSRASLRDSLIRLSTGAELVIVESGRGLFDHYPEESSYPCIADIAVECGFPLVLVVDAHGMYEGIEPLLRGVTEFRSDLKIAGVIANRVKNEAHGARIKQSVLRVRGLRYLGGVPFSASVVKSGTSVTEGDDNPSLLTRSRLMSLGEIVKSSVDFNSLQTIASQVQPLMGEVLSQVKDLGQCKIGVADDAAFHLTFQDNLDLMRRLGAEILPFSPLADTRLPHNVQGLYFPSGYPHLYATDLSANKLMLNAIRDFAKRGGVVYAEGDAIAYTARKLSLSDGSSHEMLGLLPGVVASSFSERDFVESQPCEVVAHKASILAPAGVSFRGVKSSRWIVRVDEPVLSCFQIKLKGASSAAPILDGYCPAPHILIATVQTHWGLTVNNEQALVRHFVDAVAVS